MQRLLKQQYFSELKINQNLLAKMEPWQREHIRKHLVELIMNTEVNTHLIASLIANKVISQNNAEAIEHQILTPSGQSRKLYEILQTKTNSFEILIRTLDETRQSGAAKILREHMPQAQTSRSAFKIPGNTQGRIGTAELQTEKLSLKNQSQSKTILQIFAQKLRAFTTNTDVLNSKTETTARSSEATIAVADQVYEDSKSMFTRSNEKISKENDCVLMTPEVKECIDKCNQKLQEEEFKGQGITLLHMAVMLGDKATVEYLISKGADVNACDYKGKTPFHWSSVSDNRMREICNVLVKNGAIMISINKSKGDMLFRAARSVKSKETLEAIVRAGADINLRGEWGETVMHAAVKGGNVEALKYFVSLGLDINVRDSFDRTPLHYIAYEEVNFVEMLNVALDNGADINAVDNLGQSTLHLSAKKGLSKEKLEALVRAGADVNLKTKYGDTVMRLGGNK